MYTLSQLEKQQVGLRIPKYLVDDIEEFTTKFSVNRTDIIIEAIKSYIQAQNEDLLYSRFDASCKEVKAIINGEIEGNSLSGLINELETDFHS